MPRFGLTYILVGAVAALTIACNGGGDGDEKATPRTSPESTVTAQATPAGDIRDVDLQSNEDVRELANAVGGEVVQQDVIYADVTEDGVEEAIVPISSGGTAGNLAFAVLTPQGDGARALLSEQASGRGGIALEVTPDGQLIATEPVYGPEDPECCPSLLLRTTYGWNGAALALVDEETVDNPAGQVKPTPSAAP